MRMLPALCLALAVSCPAASAEAARKATRKPPCDARGGSSACDDRRARTGSEEIDEIKARDQDPSGNYKGYPAWARRALSPPTGADQ